MARLCSDAHIRSCSKHLCWGKRCDLDINLPFDFSLSWALSFKGNYKEARGEVIAAEERGSILPSPYRSLSGTVSSAGVFYCIHVLLFRWEAVVSFESKLKYDRAGCLVKSIFATELNEPFNPSILWKKTRDYFDGFHCLLVRAEMKPRETKWDDADLGRWFFFSLYLGSSSQGVSHRAAFIGWEQGRNRLWAMLCLCKQKWTK